MIPPATSIQEIYQHYHRGPVAVLRLFERVFESVSLYGSPSEDQQERSLRLMSEEIDRLKTQSENQREQIGRLRQLNEVQSISQAAIRCQISLVPIARRIGNEARINNPPQT